MSFICWLMTQSIINWKCAHLFNIYRFLSWRCDVALLEVSFQKCVSTYTLLLTWLSVLVHFYLFVVLKVCKFLCAICTISTSMQPWANSQVEGGRPSDPGYCASYQCFTTFRIFWIHFSLALTQFNIHSFILSTVDKIGHLYHRNHWTTNLASSLSFFLLNAFCNSHAHCYHLYTFGQF